MQLVKLTRQDGELVWVNPKSIMRVCGLRDPHVARTHIQFEAPEGEFEIVLGKAESVVSALHGNDCNELEEELFPLGSEGLKGGILCQQP